MTVNPHQILLVFAFVFFAIDGLYYKNLVGAGLACTTAAFLFWR